MPIIYENQRFSKTLGFLEPGVMPNHVSVTTGQINRDFRIPKT